MFETHPSAEIPLPPDLAPFGERSWNWIEISVYKPYFYVTINVQIAEDATCGRHFLFSDLRSVLGLIAEQHDQYKDLKIGLMSPGYMNGSDFYQIGRVKEIWEGRSGQTQMFVMSDGTKLYYSNKVDGIMDKEMELMVSL